MLESIQKENWNKFILENRGSFLQSYEWGEFQEQMDRRVFRFAGDKWQVQFIEISLPFDKKYWYAPRGPVIENSKFKSQNEKLQFKIQNLFGEVKKAAGESVIFFRLGPEATIGQLLIEQLNSLSFQQLPYDIEPSQTLILDITKSEDELLAQMHEKWRYNIRLAQKKEIQVKIVNAQDEDFNKYFEAFYELVDEGTSERKNIKHHPEEYYRQQLEINGEDIKFNLFVAEFEGKVIAANIMVIFGSKATYLHGATSNERREAMAPHLLQWEQIKYAKAQSCTEYDFWGIANEHTLDRRGKSWKGFTRFKKGFGGQEVNYVGYFDYPLNKNWYFLYRLVQKFRR